MSKVKANLTIERDIKAAAQRLVKTHHSTLSQLFSDAVRVAIRSGQWPQMQTKVFIVTAQTFYRDGGLWSSRTRAFSRRDLAEKWAQNLIKADDKNSMQIIRDPQGRILGISTEWPDNGFTKQNIILSAEPIINEIERGEQHD